MKGERKGIKFWTEKLIIGTVLAWTKILKMKLIINSARGLSYFVSHPAQGLRMVQHDAGVHVRPQGQSRIFGAKLCFGGELCRCLLRPLKIWFFLF